MEFCYLSDQSFEIDPSAARLELRDENFLTDSFAGLCEFQSMAKASLRTIRM